MAGRATRWCRPPPCWSETPATHWRTQSSRRQTRRIQARLRNFVQYAAKASAAHSTASRCAALMQDNAVDLQLAQPDIERLSRQGATPAPLAQEGELVGLITLRDQRRPESKAALAWLR